MSRLEQMRQHFLQRVYREQQQSVSLSRYRTKSIHHIPSLIKFSPVPSALRRTSSGLQSFASVPFRENEYSNKCYISKTNITRVKSLSNVYLMQPNQSKPKSVNNKHSTSSETKRNSIPSVASSTAAMANNGKVNRLASKPNAASRALPAEHKRSTANNSNRKESLQCKQCDRKFAAKERLDKHVDICTRTFHKQRPVFNSCKQRLRDHLGGKQTEQSDQSTQASSPIEKTGQSNESDAAKESNPRPVGWKEKREHFLNIIKEAKLKSTKPNSEHDSSNRDESTVEANFMYCNYCKRTFGMNVIIKHQIICGKLFRKKHFNV